MQRNSSDLVRHAEQSQAKVAVCVQSAVIDQVPHPLFWWIAAIAATLSVATQLY